MISLPSTHLHHPPFLLDIDSPSHAKLSHYVGFGAGQVCSFSEAFASVFVLFHALCYDNISSTSKIVSKFLCISSVSSELCKISFQHDMKPIMPIINSKLS